jgi:hypothetical protein
MMPELVPYEPTESMVPDVVNPYDEYYDLVASGGGFLPRLQLFIANSAMVKEDKIAMNHYGLVTGKDQVEDLGKEVDVLLLSWRPRALDTSDKSNIRASSDINSDLFKEIQELSGEENSGAMFGPEYLLWIASRQKYATVLFGSKSARNEARNVSKYMKAPCTFKSRLIKTPKYSWQAMLVTACSTPFLVPTQEDQKPIIEEFLQPREISGAEKAEPVGSTRVR